MNVHQLCISPAGGPRRRVRGHKRLDSSSSSSSTSSTSSTTTSSSSSSSSSADDLPVAVKCARLSVITETTRGGGGGGGDARQVVAAAAAAAAAVLGSSSSPPGSPTTTTAPTTTATTTTTTVPNTTAPHAAAAAASVTPHPGPSRIGPFLLLPALADRDGVHSALNTDTGDELVCKVFDMAVYQEKIRGYSALPPHANVAAVRDIVLGERRAYVFWDPQHGDLHALVRSRRRLDEGHARALFRQAARAVAHCHRAGVVLGDLKLRKFVFADEKR
ncbi:hypothetical protein CRUP_035931 [Coryphaenoides rupestris]|nr:hypothetical protein CRUP_035931 [Coryphaenoides rupestris]